MKMIVTPKFEIKDSKDKYADSKNVWLQRNNPITFTTNY